MNARIVLIFVIILWTASSQETIAQLSTSRCKWINTSERSFLIDTLSLQPGSINVTYPREAGISVDYDIHTNKAFIQGESLPDSIRICYKVFPFNFSKPYFKRDLSLYDSNQIYSENTTYGMEQEPREEIFSTPGINKSGAITRGITVGNTQNVFVNSTLNLQLEGKLSEDINVLAVISDQNVPFQPEGNTQTINEFDKVFIKFYNKNGSISAGDLVMENKSSNFLRYYRNVQGGQVEYAFNKNEKINSTTTISGAVSKGKFASIQIDKKNGLAEGVQGPYRIKVSDTERFVIILANSEKVYLDGRLLERGYNYDYIIDYNLAEITFTSKVLITKYSRVRIDVEYAERNYSRTITTASHLQNVGKTSFNFNYFNQKDNPRNPLLLNLSTRDQDLLSSVGDSINFALASSIDSVAFDPNKILYKKIDTLTASGNYNAYVASTNQSEAFYEISFSEVGLGQGDYILSTSTSNGRSFVWVEPVGGIHQGNYAPVRLLPAPVKQEMATFAAAYNFSKTDKVYIETALSSKDNNLYSSLDDADNSGQALKVGYENTGRKLALLNGYNWIGVVDYEFNSKTFNPIDRFRGIEFNRDWSVGLNEVLDADENIFNAGAGIVKNNLERIEYKFTRRVRGSLINGNQHKAALYQKFGNFYFKSDYFNLISHRPNHTSYWQRFKVDVSYATPFVVPGYTYESDKNEVRQNELDTILSSAMHFDEHRVYLQNPDSAKHTFLVDYSYRTNNWPVSGELRKRDNVQTVNGSFGKNIGPNSINLTLTYRNLENYSDSLTNKKEETVMARIDHSQYFFKKSIRSELTYYTFTGRELRREYIFLLVPTGEGTHTWRDENEDGIKDLNEFYEAINTDEKNYVKFFVPTDQYIQAYTSNLNYRLNIASPASWRTVNGIKKLISHFSLISSWTIEKKTTSENLEARLLPFVTEVLQSNIISYRESLRSTLFYNKMNSSYGADFGYNATKYKQPLTNGFELRTKDEYRGNGRLNLSSSLNTKVGVVFSETRASSDFLLSRNFIIHSYKASPEIAYQPRNNFRLSSTYSYTFKENLANPETGKIAIFNEVALDLRWTKLTNRALNGTIRYTRINYNGEVNNAASYEILEALRPGGNYGWTINWLQKLSNGLQLSVNYEGRKSEAQRMIHVGRMMVSALF